MNTYFLTYACMAECETCIMEFDTYEEAFAIYKAREIAGYSVFMQDIDFQGTLANEIRKSPDYRDMRGA